MYKALRYLSYIGLIVSITSVCLMYFIISSGPVQPELTVHFLDIGQGDAILLETPEHTQILIDAGAGRKVVEELSEVMPWWDRTIEYVLITHPDLDHYGG